MKTNPHLFLSLCAFGGSALAAETTASAAQGSGSQSKKPPNVLLLFYWKGRILSGKEVSDLVELVDLYPTLMEFCGIAPPPSVKLAGRSLVPVLTEGQPVGRRYAIAENYSQISVITDRYKLGHWTEPPMAGRDFCSFGDLLFDRLSDPLELTNLAGKPGLAEVERQLRNDLAEWEQSTPDAATRAAVEKSGVSKAP